MIRGEIYPSNSAIAFTTNESRYRYKELDVIRGLGRKDLPSTAG